MANVTLPICLNEDETLEEVVAELTEGTTLETKVLSTAGSAGGWPDVEFSGTDADVLLLAERYSR